MTHVLSQHPLLLAVATFVVGMLMASAAMMGDHDGGSRVQSIRASCAGLLLVALSGVQIGLLLLASEAWSLLGYVALLASVPSCLLMAFGALSSLPEHGLRLPNGGPWDDDAIHP